MGRGGSGRPKAQRMVSITDGPFAETKQCLAGFYLIEATDLNDAVQIASQIPPARVGSIEVRPVRELMSRSGERRQLYRRSRLSPARQAADEDDTAASRGRVK